MIMKENIKIVWTSEVPGETLADVYVNDGLSFVNLQRSDVDKLVSHIDPNLCDVEYFPPEPDIKDVEDKDDELFTGAPWDDDKHLESYETDMEDSEAQAAYDDHWGTQFVPEGYGS